jgi:hypothetical protein
VDWLRRASSTPAVALVSAIIEILGALSVETGENAAILNRR